MRSPVILVLPGGAYSAHAEHEGEPVAQWLRGIGWDARVVRYPVQTRHPAPLAFVQEQISAERTAGAPLVGVIGFSAGGHLAGHAALDPDASPLVRPDFAILCYPVVSMLAASHRVSREFLLGPDATDEERRNASLDQLVTPAAPPMFVWTTGEDADVPPADHSYPLALALARAGVAHDFHVFDRGAHGLGFAEGLPAAAWRGLCQQWLEELLRGHTAS